MVMKACATLIGETIRSTPMAVRVVVAVMAGLLSVLLLLRALLRGRRAGAGAAHGDKRFAEELIRYMEMDGAGICSCISLQAPRVAFLVYRNNHMTHLI